MKFNWIAHNLVHHPYVIIIAVAVFSGTCLVIPFTLKTKTFLDFSDPQMGFQTRGTTISNRLTAWKNLVRSSSEFAINPREEMTKQNNSVLYGRQRKVGKKVRNRKKPLTTATILYEPNNRTDNSIDVNWKDLINLNISHKPKEPFRFEKSKGNFCGYPDKQYAHLVIKSVNNANLFTLQSLLRLCRLENEFIGAKYYKDLCVETNKFSQKCCRPWSLANYIAALHNRTSCLTITNNLANSKCIVNYRSKPFPENKNKHLFLSFRLITHLPEETAVWQNEQDVNSTIALLTQCAQYFHNLQLRPDCIEGQCESPEKCYKEDAVFNVLNYLTSTSFLPPGSNESVDHVLLETMIFFPVACSVATLQYYHEVERLDLEYEGISVVAMEFGIKSALFDECLISDAWLMASGAVFVLLCMWLYTKSLFLTIMTIIAIVFSLGIAFFLYLLVFELSFFPFMNLLATVVAIGIGADDTFIFCKFWCTIKSQGASSITKIMSETLSHAFTSMFVASLTTCVAFLASYLSSVTAICCFSIFAASAVIANYFMMITWFPACVVLWERSCCSNFDVVKNCMMACLQRWCCGKLITPQWNLSASWPKCSLIGSIWDGKERCLVNCVINLRYFWFTFLSLLSIGGAAVVFCYPKLQLPNSPDFQLFDASHPFEQYEINYKHHFWFERLEKESDSYLNYKLPLRFVWGVLPVDNGDHLNPSDLGKLELDPTFDMSDPSSQEWLLQFCRNLRQQSFYQSTLGPLLPNCFIETFKKSMERKCVDAFTRKDRSPCCKTATFPFNSTIFNECVLDEMSDIYETPREFLIPGMAGPKFSKDQNPTIKAVIVEYDSNYTYSLSFDHMDEFFTLVEKWMQEQLKTAPKTMKNGWFVSDLDFYDLQRELSVSTLIAIAVSMGLALLVLLLSTLNILTSLYAILTITCSIFVTMAVLVLMGWKLNVLESVAISTSIGLTVDFSLHYSVNYGLCPVGLATSRQAATRYALSNMAGPVLMAAITTGAAGAFMMPSVILPYIQIGIFLVTVMSVSWFYATFFLGSLLAIIGPESYFGQFHYSKIFCWVRRSKTASVDRNRPAVSSVSDTHELDSLNSKSSVRTAPRALQRSLSGGGASKSNPNRYVFSDQSPSATSAITIIMADDN